MTALIIDDCPDARHILRGYLSDMGIEEVEERSTLEGAVQALRDARFDVVCLDLHLSDSPTTETLASLPVVTALAQGAPILVVTGFPSLLQPGVERYVQGILQKPFNSYDFKSAVRSAMRCTEPKSPFSASLLTAAFFRKPQLQLAGMPVTV